MTTISRYASPNWPDTYKTRDVAALLAALGATTFIQGEQSCKVCRSLVSSELNTSADRLGRFITL